MPAVRRLGDLGFDPGVLRTRELVGSDMIITAVRRFTSQRYGAGYEFNADVVDTATGEMAHRDVRVVSFGKAVARVAEFLLGVDGVDSVRLPEAVQVTVDLDGNTVVLR